MGMPVAMKMAEARLSRPLQEENDLEFSVDDHGTKIHHDDGDRYLPVHINSEANQIIKMHANPFHLKR